MTDDERREAERPECERKIRQALRNSFEDHKRLIDGMREAERARSAKLLSAAKVFIISPSEPIEPLQKAIAEFEASRDNEAGT